VKNPSPLTAQFFAEGKVAACPIIDCHAHYGPFQGIYFPNVTPEAMVATMDRAGVRLVISSGHAALVNPTRGNAELAEVIARFPTRFRGYLALNPNYPEQLGAEVARFDELGGFVGLKFLSDYHRYPITGDNYRPALEFAAARGLPILMHTWGGSGYDSPQLVAELAGRYPTVPLLMGHSGHGDWAATIATATAHANVYLELCAAYATRGVIGTFVEALGSERILFGTDLPWFDPHYGIGCVLMERISDDDRRNILHRNAERLFGEALPA
jgi:hypothetical protein